jgi:hypothetical protein
MSKVMNIAIALVAIVLPGVAGAQPPAPTSSAADLRYCAELSELYARYVGRSEAGPRTPVTPNVNGGVALAKCREGDAAAAIPMLERMLVNAGFTLPPRG